MSALQKLKTFDEICDDFLKRGERDQVNEALNIVKHNAEFLRQLFNISDTDIRERFLSHLRERADAIKTGTAKGSASSASVERSRLNVVPVSSHARRPPPTNRCKLNAVAELSVRTASARNVLMMIDGIDVRKWTIGQCLNSAPKRQHEANVLRRLGEMYGHMPNHNAEIGTVSSDAIIAEVIAQTK